MSSGVTAVSVAVDGKTTCAIQSGALYCWGDNTYGQLGVGTTSGTYYSPAAVQGAFAIATNVTAVSTSVDHTCAVAGTVAYCWGDNSVGQLGNNKTSTPIVPTENAPYYGSFPTTAIAAAGGYTCSIQLSVNNTGYYNVACWGSNSRGQLGEPALELDEPDYFAIAGGTSQTVTAVTAGPDHACALAGPDGTKPYCWGNNDNGEIGDGTFGPMNSKLTATAVTSFTSATGIAAGGTHTCAVNATSAACWGGGSSYQLDTSIPIATQVAPLTLPPKHLPATSIAAGSSTTCFIHSSTVVCVGSDGLGGTVIGPTCGDGYVDAGEACDDGNATSGDGCDSSCRVQIGYSCTGSPSQCTANCGNGVLDAGEACDDGNTTSADGCSSSCLVESGYSCTGAPSACHLTCSNGVLDPGETCDDGNASSGDGCSSTCQIENAYSCTGAPSTCALTCSNGVLDPGETCDDGNNS
jgi:cysteine-rich repeat protein